MHIAFISTVAALAAFNAVSARIIVITVGGNTTTDASMVFSPQRVDATLGDTVFFNFTQGNHTVTQSTFASPCIRAHDTNITINGFDSSFRNAGQGNAITNLEVPILQNNANQPMWFFDYSTCGQGGVGVINNNESSTETLDGFERNAIRLNGTESTSSTSLASSTTGSSSPSSTSVKKSGAGKTVATRGAVVLLVVLVGMRLMI